MRIIQQRIIEVSEVPLSISEGLLLVERAGRTCYQSASEFNLVSAERFVDKIIKRGHWSVIEHSNLVFFCNFVKDKDFVERVKGCKFLNVFEDYDGVYTGGNWRAWMEFLGLRKLSELREFCPDGFVQLLNPEDVPLHMRRIYVYLVTDRAVLAELTRHRLASFSVESQRYVGYRGDVEFVEQWWEAYNKEISIAYREDVLHRIEKAYQHALLVGGLRSEEARAILPNSTAVRIAISAEMSEWDHIFHLRCGKGAYPQMRHLMNTVCEHFRILGVY